MLWWGLTPRYRFRVNPSKPELSDLALSLLRCSTAQLWGVVSYTSGLERTVLTWNGTGADLARRLHAAAEGGSYEDGLTSDDAEISDLDQAAAQGAHPSEQLLDHHGQKGEEEDVEDEEEEEEIDIMNSPLQRPWGTDVGAVLPCHCVCNSAKCIASSSISWQ